MTDAHTPPVGRFLLGFAVLGGIVAWTLHLLVSYALVPVVCATAGETLLHLITAATALGAAAATGAAWSAHRRLATASGEQNAARRFLALAGILLGAFFLALIVIEGLPALLQEDPCGALPTLDRPIIHRIPELPFVDRG